LNEVVAIPFESPRTAAKMNLSPPSVAPGSRSLWSAGVTKPLPASFLLPVFRHRAASAPEQIVPPWFRRRCARRSADADFCAVHVTRIDLASAAGYIHAPLIRVTKRIVDAGDGEPIRDLLAGHDIESDDRTRSTSAKRWKGWSNSTSTRCFLASKTGTPYKSPHSDPKRRFLSAGKLLRVLTRRDG